MEGVFFYGVRFFYIFFLEREELNDLIGKLFKIFFVK